MTEEITGEETWLSQEAYDRLSKELETLQGPGRADIAEKIDAAREEGDLKENGGYHAAREEQGKIEARIRQLEHLLRHATVGEASSDLSVASPGTVISEASPLGTAVNGTKVGESTSYEAPNGKSIAVTVDKVEAFG